MKPDQFEVAFSAVEKSLAALEKAQAKAVEAALATEVREIEKGKWGVLCFGRSKGIFVEIKCEELTGYIEVGYLQKIMDPDMEHIAEGDVPYGEKLLADLRKLVNRTEKALAEGRKHPFEP